MTNVILITVDCLRADHLGCMGYSRDTSPFLDSLSKKSLFFTHAFSNGPNTRHSVPSFLSSTYPLLFLEEAKGGRFHPGRKSIAEVLKENGYHTAGIHSNPYVSSFYGYNRGFDYFNDFLLGQVESDIQENQLRKKMREGIKGIKAVFFHQLPHETGEQINDVVFQWLETASEPFFLWIHYMDVHMPYVPPNKFLKEIDVKTYSHARKIWMGKKIDDVRLRSEIKDEEIPDYVNLYDGTIRYTDQVINDLITNVEQRFSDTLFVLTADHGEEFREHGGLSHVEKLYDELLHVPLFFYGKNIRNERVDMCVSLIDVAPTILDAINISEEPFFGGKNMNDSDGIVFAEAFKDERICSVRSSDWKLIVSPTTKELYHLSDDASESKNIYLEEKHNKQVNFLEKKLEFHTEKVKEAGQIFETIRQREKIKKISKKINNSPLKNK
jgi:arylsulfatase A-like enzyme